MDKTKTSGNMDISDLIDSNDNNDETRENAWSDDTILTAKQNKGSC